MKGEIESSPWRSRRWRTALSCSWRSRQAVGVATPRRGRRSSRIATTTPSAAASAHSTASATQGSRPLGGLGAEGQRRAGGRGGRQPDQPAQAEEQLLAHLLANLPPLAESDPGEA